MRDYHRKGCSERGAFMGRVSDLPLGTTARLALTRVPLDQGGYDPGGAYWGQSTITSLYCAEDVVDGSARYVRAASFDAARARFPYASWTTLEPTSHDIEDMLRGYVQCALFTGMDESDEARGAPLDANYDVDDLAETSLAVMRDDCLRFVSKVPDAAARAAAVRGWDGVGRDLWFTQNGHGTGFWDREELTDEDRITLTNAARDMGESYMIVGDGGKLHV